jgi:hypothetical protein
MRLLLYVKLKNMDASGRLYRSHAYENDGQPLQLRVLGLWSVFG